MKDKVREYIASTLDRHILESYDHQLKSIVKICSSINSEYIKDAGYTFFPFVESGDSVDSMTKAHCHNIVALCNAVGDTKQTYALKREATHILQNSLLSHRQKFQRIIRIQKQLILMSPRIIAFDIYSIIGHRYISSCTNWRKSNREIRKEEISLDDVQITIDASRFLYVLQYLHSIGIIPVIISDMTHRIVMHILGRIGVQELFVAHFSPTELCMDRREYSVSLFSRILEIMHIDGNQAIFVGTMCSTSKAQDAGWKWHIVVDPDGVNDAIFNCKHNLIISSIDDMYELMTGNGIRFVPRIMRTAYTTGYSARMIDEPVYRRLYALRQLVKYFPDRRLRELIYSYYLCFYIGTSSRIGNNVEIRYPDRIYIGDNCQIGDDITILNEAPVIIGDNVMIARGVFMSTHHHAWRLGMLQDATPSWKKGNTTVYPISIEENVWIGPNVVIEADTYIGHHSIIGANSLLKSGIYPPYSFIAGTPARVVRTIENELEHTRRTFMWNM